MKYSSKIEKAIKVAATEHDGQYRKAYLRKLPYVSHLFSVAAIISEYTDDEDIISAGILHDIIEDTDYTEKELRKEFEEKVSSLVMAVTEGTKSEKKEMSWREEKEKYLRNLMNGSPEASLISSADKIHNLMSSIELKKIMSRSPADYDWFHTEVFNIVKNKLGNHPIIKVHEKVLLLSREFFK